jgi:hypothetical protein
MTISYLLFRRNCPCLHLKSLVIELNALSETAICIVAGQSKNTNTMKPEPSPPGIAESLVRLAREITNNIRINSYRKPAYPSRIFREGSGIACPHNQKMFCGSILETVSSLESYVQQTVFGALKYEMDPLLINWLEQKTRMDSDSLLSKLTLVATEANFDKKSFLFSCSG